MGLGIVAFIDSLGPGGAERVMATLTGCWSRQGHSVSVVTLAHPSTDFYELDDRIERVGIGLLGPANSRLAAAAFNVRRAKRIRRLLTDRRPDVAISFIDRMNVVVLAASRGLELPVVVSERTDPRCYQLDPSVRALRRVLYPRAHAIVVQTRAVAEAWAVPRFGGRRVHVIPNPVGPDFGGGLPMTREKQFVGVGRLGPEKGFDVLVSAFARIAPDLRDWSLHIYGEGPDRGSLERLAEHQGCSSQVRFHGITTDVAAVLKRAGVFVLSSRFEGFPNVLLEAMASGAPAVSFACPSGPDEIIDHEETGLLVAPGDERALGEAMGRVAADDVLRARLATAGLEAAARFRPEVVATAWGQLLKAAVPPARR